MLMMATSMKIYDRPINRSSSERDGPVKQFLSHQRIVLIKLKALQREKNNNSLACTRELVERRAPLGLISMPMEGALDDGVFCC